jgi:hypothetical protein
MLTSHSNITLMQFRDDSRLVEAKIKYPSEDVKAKYPVFCHRLALARCTHKFSKIGQDGCPNASLYTDRFEDLHTSISEWRESIPVC